jgi:23S rRNA pseudouridine1911/1915/1917 synthase
MNFTVIYEDNHLLVVNKPANVLVQGDDTHDKPLVDLAKEYLKEKYNKTGNVFCGLVHRLDRPVSGLVVLAKTSKCLERMNKIFQERKVQKTYWAIVQQQPPQPKDTLTHWLIKNEAKNIVKAYTKEQKGSQLAILDYRYIKKVQDVHWLEVKPLTGRPHQIRVQLAAMGCAIKGDLKYGYPTPNADASIHLHARSIEFMHPIQQTQILLTATLPQEPFWQWLRKNEKLDN